MSTPSRHLSDAAAIAVVSLIFFTWGGLTSLNDLPLRQGALADRIGIQLAFVILLVCYAYIVWYGLRGSRLTGDELAAAHSAGRTAGPMH